VGRGILLALGVALLGVSAGAATGQPVAAFHDALRGGGAGPEMVALPGGAVALGETPYDVTLSPFAIARDDVTNAQFAAFLDHAGDTDADGIAYLVPTDAGGGEIALVSGRHRVQPGREDLPVTGVSWQGALAYARWLSGRTGHRYFLPTEAQWEYAARAGTQSAWPWGETFDPTRANCGAPSIAPPRPVGSYPPNGFGLRDMVGNVWQWMADCFPNQPEQLGRHDPSGYAAGCVTPSIRGGAAPNQVALCKPTFRVNYWWRGAAEMIGFRVVRLDIGQGRAM
jgi:formylglycine-generating enzyme required for sulfatase activity